MEGPEHRPLVVARAAIPPIAAAAAAASRLRAVRPLDVLGVGDCKGQGLQLCTATQVDPAQHKPLEGEAVQCAAHRGGWDVKVEMGVPVVGRQVCVLQVWEGREQWEHLGGTQSQAHGGEGGVGNGVGGDEVLQGAPEMQMGGFMCDVLGTVVSTLLVVMQFLLLVCRVKLHRT